MLPGSAATNAGQLLLAAHSVCGKCGAARIDKGIGLEATLDEYLAKLVAVFREVRRVMKSMAALWLNMGDVYANDGKWGGETAGKQSYLPGPDRKRNGREKRRTGLKSKDLCGLPWRLAFRLQEDGWYLRSGMPWLKRSSMPESIRDRPASALEYVFLLTKSPHYYFDMEAVRKRDLGTDHARNVLDKPEPSGGVLPSHNGIRTASGRNGSGRNYRNTDLWFESIAAPHGLCSMGDELVGLDVNPEPLREAHYVAYPCRLVEPLIKAGCPPGGTVLDPFCGTGTTLLVAYRLGRSSIGIELSPAYVEMAKARILNDQGLVKDERLNGHTLPLFEEPSI